MEQVTKLLQQIELHKQESKQQMELQKQESKEMAEQMKQQVEQQQEIISLLKQARM